MTETLDKINNIVESLKKDSEELSYELMKLEEYDNTTLQIIAHLCTQHTQSIRYDVGQIREKIDKTLKLNKEMIE